MATEAGSAPSILRPLADDLAARRAQARLGGGREKIAKRHEAAKLTARERIELLVEPGTFVELIAAYRQIIDVYIAAKNGMIDDVIGPRETRPVICRALEWPRERGCSGRGSATRWSPSES